MFAFEKLAVYQRVKVCNTIIFELIENTPLKPYLRDQLGRASLSIRLNIAEGSSRVSIKDKSHFLVIARGSAFECVSLLELLLERNHITEKQFDSLYHELEEISKMLYGLIKKLRKDI